MECNCHYPKCQKCDRIIYRDDQLCMRCIIQESKTLLNNTEEKINHPSHYQSSSMEVIEIIEAFNLNFHLGNAIKYTLRAGKKGDKIEDLDKAMWYLERERENERKKLQRS